MRASTGGGEVSRTTMFLAGEDKNWELASPTGFELQPTKNDDDAEQFEVIDISKLKKGEG